MLSVAVVIVNYFLLPAVDDGFSSAPDEWFSSAPIVSVVPPLDGSDLMVFWSFSASPKSYFVWYDCDGMESLVELNGTEITATIPSVRE